MEQMQELTHPSDDQLASFWAGTLSRVAVDALVAHVDTCAACAARLDEFEPALAQYRLVHGQIPETGGEGLWKKMEEIEARRAHRERRWALMWRPVWVACAAAAAAAIAMLVLPHGGGMELRAETLLIQSIKVAPRPAPGRHIRVKTRRASFERPATATATEDTRLRTRFEEANYNWNDPLSAQSYLDWHRSRRNKTTTLASSIDGAGQAQQTIETKTDDGTLRDASLTLDAKLIPVSAWFQFSDNERVEIITEPDPAVASVPTLPLPQSGPAVPVPLAKPEEPRAPIAERAIEVFLAIDALQADAGEPIDVTTSPGDDIVVTTYGLAPELEAKLRAGLEPIRGVTLRLGAAQAHPEPRRSGEPQQLMRASQDVSFEAHLLDGLAERFDSSTETGLLEASKSKLWELRMKHAALLDGDLAKLRDAIEKERPGFRTQRFHAGGPQALGPCAAAIDRSITQLFAGAAIDNDQDAIWRQLEIEIGRLEALANDYSRIAEQRRKDLP